MCERIKFSRKNVNTHVGWYGDVQVKQWNFSLPQRSASGRKYSSWNLFAFIPTAMNRGEERHDRPIVKVLGLVPEAKACPGQKRNKNQLPCLPLEINDFVRILVSDLSGFNYSKACLYVVWRRPSSV